jgi:hypothetical protein
MKNFCFLFFCCLIFFFNFFLSFSLKGLSFSYAYAQTQKFSHEDDERSLFRTLEFWGIRDNADEVFSKPVTEKISAILAQHKQISFTMETSHKKNPLTLTPLEKKNLLKNKNHDGALWGEILKQDRLFKLKFSLFDK